MSWGPVSVCLLRWQITCWRNNFFLFLYWILYFPVHLKIFEKQLQTFSQKEIDISGNLLRRVHLFFISRGFSCGGGRAV
ncbi:MAG TPA: hypothetical protein O0X72_04645, partial [Methanocorpusculum sp.]|nr:hypothetical protein [Methanocorpusculum sp.]